MRRQAGFTLVEMVIATTLFVAGSVYIYGALVGVTKSSQNATVQIDLGSQNKRAITKLYNELQATSVTPQDTDGLDSTDPVAVFELINDASAPPPLTPAKVVNRLADPKSDGTVWEVGAGQEQARERVITQSKRINFRKVVGYQFNASSGTIVPEWSAWVSYFVNPRRQLVRQVPGKSPKVVANKVDAFDVIQKPDATLLVTLITARRLPDGSGFKRYANAVVVHPKN